MMMHRWCRIWQTHWSTACESCLTSHPCYYAITESKSVIHPHTFQFPNESMWIIFCDIRRYTGLTKGEENWWMGIWTRTRSSSLGWSAVNEPWRWMNVEYSLNEVPVLPTWITGIFMIFYGRPSAILLKDIKMFVNPLTGNMSLLAQLIAQWEAFILWCLSSHTSSRIKILRMLQGGGEEICKY